MKASYCSGISNQQKIAKNYQLAENTIEKIAATSQMLSNDFRHLSNSAVLNLIELIESRTMLVKDYINENIDLESEE